MIKKAVAAWKNLKNRVEFLIFLEPQPKIYRVKIYYLEIDGHPKGDVYYPLLISRDTLQAMICAGIIYAINTFEPARLYSHYTEENLHVRYYEKRNSYYGALIFHDLKDTDVEKILNSIEAEEVK